MLRAGLGAKHGDQRGLLCALARRARFGRGLGLGGGARSGFFGRRAQRARGRGVRVLRLDADGGEARVGGNQRGAVAVAGLASQQFD